MLRVFIDADQVKENVVRITGDDVRHIRKVLRLKVGEDFEAVDPNEEVYTCRIAEMTSYEVVANVLFAQPSGAELPNKITLYMGIPKFDKMEFILQKAVELGATTIIPVMTSRTVVRLDERRAASKLERWQMIARSAAEQAKRGMVPTVGRVCSFEEALEAALDEDLILFPYENATGMDETRDIFSDIPKGKSAAVFIGPEGGFAPEEVEAARTAGAKIVTLGRRVLRTETAAIAVLSLLMFMLENN